MLGQRELQRLNYYEEVTYTLVDECSFSQLLLSLLVSRSLEDSSLPAVFTSL